MWTEDSKEVFLYPVGLLQQTIPFPKIIPLRIFVNWKLLFWSILAKNDTAKDLRESRPNCPNSKGNLLLSLLLCIIAYDIGEETSNLIFDEHENFHANLFEKNHFFRSIIVILVIYPL